MVSQPGSLLQEQGRNRVRHPAVALPQQGEEYLAAIDFVQADRQDFAALGLLLGDAPAQVHFRKQDAAHGAQPAHLREDKLGQHFPLGVHVAEGGRNEDPEEHGSPLLRKCRQASNDSKAVWCQA